MTEWTSARSFWVLCIWISSEFFALMIRIAVAGGKGYVWDADDVMRLRLDCKLVGSLTGGVSQFKNQNAVNGLPLELHADEVTLAVQRGWAVLYNSTLPAGALAPTSRPAIVAVSTSKKRKHEEDDYDDYYAQYEAEETEAGMAGGGGDGLDGSVGHQTAVTVAETTPVTMAPTAEEQAAARAAEGAWRAALAGGSSYTIPLTHKWTGSATEAGGEGAATSVDWTYPATPYERLRFAVFCDLHSQGFMMTGGAKFGCDMLAYPGDPALYHAQFTVRIVLPGTALNPMLLKAAGRGSHAARKHLLLATLPKVPTDADSAVKPVYVSIAPETGFGSKA